MRRVRNFVTVLPDLIKVRWSQKLFEMVYLEAKHLLVSDRICLIVLRQYLSQALFYECAYDRNCRNVLREILS